MNIEEFREYCLSKEAVSEDFPFDNKILVYKVAGKLFALTDIDQFISINLKCDPERATELREEYQSVLPGYHMNKKHWNTVENNGDVDESLMRKLIDDSYMLVVKGLPKKVRDQLSSR